MKFENIAQMFFGRAAQYGARPRYRAKRDGRWIQVSWEACARRVREIAAGLCTLGVGPGDRVALLSATRPEWVEIDLAAVSAGAVTVPIYQSTVPAECGFILWDSGARIVFAETDAQADKVRAVARDGTVVDGTVTAVPLQHIIVIEDSGAVGDRRHTLAEVQAAGRTALTQGQVDIDGRIAALRRDDLATIVYTSGTTGPPKGVLQTHGNHLASLEAVAQLGVVTEGQVDFLFLPLAHSFARLQEYLGLYMGTVTAFAQSIDTVASDLAETRPHFVPAVPRIFEKIHGRILATQASSGVIKRTIFDAALHIGRLWSGYVRAGRPVPPAVEALRTVAHHLVFRRIHQVLGGRVRYLISGGAPLAQEIAEFFHAVGLLILEGYGLTETTPVVSANRPDAFRLGTVGLPLAGVEVRIALDGEILARGPNVARGYHNRPRETADAWDDAGWFHTGDVGEIDAEGFLRITDRKKDLIKTSGGKYVAPQKIENALKSQPHVNQVVVIGDGRKYCVVLLTLDVEAVRSWTKSRGLDIDGDVELSQHPEVVELIQGEVDTVNRELAPFESIKYFRILPRELTVEDGEVTPSMKVKRKVVAERYRDLVDAMYAD